MANTNAPFGFKPVRTINGAAWNGSANMYYIPSTDASAYYPGDPVISAAVSDGNGVMGIAKATGAATVRGVAIAFFLAPPYATSFQGTILDNTLQYVPATKSKAYYALVVDDPHTIFEVQDDGLNTPTAADVMKNASFTVTAPTSPGQISASVLATGTWATTSSLNLKAMGLAQRDNNTMGIYAKWLVMFNQHELMGNTAGV